MIHICKYSFISLVFFLFCYSFVFTPISLAESIRKPVWAGKFYPDSEAELRQTIQELTQKAQKTPFHPPPNNKLKAIIIPHAGYIYSGFTAAHVSIALKNQSFSKVILMGPDHRIGFENCAISDVDAYQTPLGRIPLHPDAQKLRNISFMFTSNPASDSQEHSLEVILPFLQYYLTSFKLVPIVVGHPRNIDQLASSIESIMDSNTLLVISSDLSHFLPYKEAVHTDTGTIQMILNKEFGKLSKSRRRACGIIPIATLLSLAIKNNWQPKLIHYSNSGDTAGDKSKVVGYAAIAFYTDQASSTAKGHLLTMSQDQGKALVRLARHTLMKKFDMKIKPSDAESLKSSLDSEVFRAERGIFVTLTIDNNLRGCIGNITPQGSIAESVQRNAMNAAFHDPRFSPMTKKEFKKAHIEVSILTEPKLLTYKNSADLIAKLRPNIDGVIIRKDMTSATFLPQVWDQLPTAEIFLSHLCRKAGLSPNTWEKSTLNVYTYQVQYFEE